MISEHDPFIAPPRINAADFTGELFGSPALDERSGEEYYNAIQSTGVDPLFMLAMFWHESQHGRLGVARETKSWGNVKADSPQFGPAPVGVVTTPDGRRFSKYATWLDGCIATAARLTAPEWVYANRDTIREIFIMPGNPVWAPIEDENDPNNYLASVVRYMNDNSGAAMPPVESAFTPINHTKSRFGYSPMAVVLHIAQGTYQGTIDWFKNPVAKVSSHFVIARDGRIAQCVKLEHMAWTNGWDYRKPIRTAYNPNFDNPLIMGWFQAHVNPNWATITIEHEGYHHEDLTDPQLVASARLTRWLCNRFNIPPDETHILGHYELDSVNKSNCPGMTRAEWQRYITAVSTGAVLPPADPVFYVPNNPHGQVPVRNPLWSRWKVLDDQGLALPMIGYPMAPAQDAGGRPIQRFERGWLALGDGQPPWDVVMLRLDEIAPSG